MEYRRRRRSSRSPRRANTLWGAAACIALVVAAVVYLVGISGARTWLAEHVVAPVFQTLGVAGDGGEAQPGEDGADASATVASELLELPAMTCYALQMGVYTTESNAEKQSVALQEVGAGGYIVQDGDRYRVLAAGYASQEELQQVRDQLTAEGIDSAAYSLTAAPSKLVVTGTGAQVDALERALNGLTELQGGLCELAIAFDRDQQPVEEGQSSIAALASTVEGYLAGVSAVSTDQAVMVSLADCCRDILAQLQKATAMPEEDRAGFTAYLKYTCLFCAEAYCAFCDAVSALGAAA